MPRASTHDHIVFHMQGGDTVTYNDPRRFGFMMLIPEKDLGEHPLLHHLGIEPLSKALTAEYLAQHARGKKVSLKPFLADQRIIAGLGNIYACEALYRARLSPKRGAATIASKTGKPNERAQALVPAIREVLDDAIKAGGSSMRDYRQANGELGVIPARVLRLRPRRQAVPAQGLRRYRAPHRAGRTLDVLLSALSALV